ncbi:amidase [Apiospora arundinis]
MFKDAIKLEKLLVGYREMHWKPLGPLHGFPISQKDTSNYADLPSTLGIVSYLDNPKLRTGFFLESAKFPVYSPVSRTLEFSAQALAEASQEVIPLHGFPSLNRARDLTLDSFSFGQTLAWKKTLDMSD